MSEYKSNKSFLMRGIEDVVYQEMPVPEVGDDEVLVEVKKTGICGSDIHFLVDGRIGHLIVNAPMVLGHESSGVIFKVGKNVKDRTPGMPVAMEPGQTCRVCDACKRGKYELCPDIIFAATPPNHGTLGRYYRLPADLTYPLPENLSLEEGAMMEPLSVAVHAVSNVGKVRANEVVAVFGAGPVGLLCMAVAKSLGAKRVIGIDINPTRLEFAKSFAATDIFQSPPKAEGETTMEYSKRIATQMKTQLNLGDIGPDGVDAVIEASGAEVSIQIGILLAKAGGRFVQVGMGHAEVTVPITLALIKELSILGSFRYGPGDYALAIALAAQGKIQLKPLITHRFAFEDAIAAFETTRRGKSDDGKAVIKAIIAGPE